MENVVIIAGSESDKWFTDKIEDECKKQGLVSKAYFNSAHKVPRKVLDIVESYEDKKVVFITVAGRSNALSGVVAANSSKPVIACPPFKDKIDFMVNINSSLQMPSSTPAMTILEPNNAVLAKEKTFSSNTHFNSISA